MVSPTNHWLQYEETPRRTKPFCRMASRATPRIAPNTVPTPPDQARPAQDDRREHVEFLADQHGRRHGLSELRLHQRGRARDQAQIAIDQAIEAEDMKAQPLRRVLVAAERIDLAPDVGSIEEQPRGQEREHENQDLQIERIGHRRSRRRTRTTRSRRGRTWAGT